MESQNANRLLLPFAQVQRLWAKSRCFSPSPGTFRQVQSFQLKSRTFGPSPGVWGQVQSFQLKSRTFGSSPGVLCQVQALWVKSSRLGPSPRLFGEIYRTSSKSSLKIPSPAPKISCMSPLGDFGGVSAPARHLPWNFDLAARLNPRLSSCLCRYQEPCES